MSRHSRDRGGARHQMTHMGQTSVTYYLNGLSFGDTVTTAHQHWHTSNTSIFFNCKIGDFKIAGGVCLQKKVCLPSLLHRL